jgi:ribosomal-protein-alanine N-acetyltransferase
VQEPIEAPDLLGAAPRDEDLDDLLALFSDQRVGAMLGGTRDREQVRAILERWQRVGLGHGCGVWVFRTRDTDALVGYAGFAPAGAIRPGAIELLYGLRPDYWGRGLATRLSRLVLRRFLESRSPRDLVAFTAVTNRASRRVLEKLGFTARGEFERAGMPHLLFTLPRAPSDPEAGP